MKKVISMLICLAFMGGFLIGGGKVAQANDTRNRILTGSTEINTQIGLNTANIPYSSQTTLAIDNATLYRESMGVINFTIYKDRIVSDNKIVLTKYLPAKAYNEVQVLMYPNINPTDVGLGIQGVETVNIGGENYFKAATLYAGNLTPGTWYVTTNVASQLIPGESVVIAKRTYGKYRNIASNRDEGYNYTGGGNSPAAGLYIKSKFGFITPYDDPTITVTNVSTNAATISWSANNTNPTWINYVLEYQTLKANGNPQVEADWGTAWVKIPLGNDTTVKSITTQPIFNPDNTYRLRVKMGEGSSQEMYSDYVVFQTASDPAVRAAQEAAIAAHAAKIAAEESMAYSLDAKNAAIDASVKSQQVYDLVNSLELGNVKNDIEYIKQTMSTPIIQSVKGQNNATATYANHFIIKVSAAGQQDNLRYKVICDSFNSGWGTSNTINITGLTGSGIKTAQIYVSSFSDDPDNGGIASEEFSFFKL